MRGNNGKAVVMPKELFLSASSKGNNYDDEDNLIDEENISYRTYLGGIGDKSMQTKTLENAFRGFFYSIINYYKKICDL